MAKVKSRKNEIYLKDMKDGEVAEVRSWFDSEVTLGTVIQRYKSALIIIGEHSDKCYPSIFDGCDELDIAKVRILSSGSEIIL